MVTDKESGSVDSVVTTVIADAKAHLASISTGVQLAFAELRVAVSHASLIICLMIVAAGIIVVGWVLLLVLGILLLMKLGWSAVMALLCVFMINIIALVGTGIAIRRTLEHLSFKHTRRALSADSSEFGCTE